jgi:4-amino-4-deoxy-L-arabinose transferase-like glycosyltransferase
MLLPPFLWLLPLWYGAYVDGRPEIMAYLQEILFRQTVHRYAAGTGHQAPVWYYVATVIPGLWMPLSVLLIWLVPDWLRKLRGCSRPHWALLSFVVLGIVFFSASPSKRGVYMLPLLPAIAVLTGGSLKVLAGRRAPVVVLRLVGLGLGLALVGLAAAAALGHGPLPRLAEKSELEMLPALLLILAIGLGWLLPALLVRSGGAFAIGACVTWVLYSTWAYVLLDPYRSDAQLMQSAAEQITAGSELAVAGFREQQLLQADRDVVHWSYHDALESQMVDAAQWLREGSNRYLLAPETAVEACFGDNAGIPVGHRHSRLWLLVPASEAPQTPRCAAEGATRYVLPYLAYPNGRTTRPTEGT